MRTIRLSLLIALVAVSACSPDAPTAANQPSPDVMQDLARRQALENQRFAIERAANAATYDSLHVQYGLLGGGLTTLTGGLLGTVTNTVDGVLGLLLCRPQPYDAEAKIIGPAGGAISVGGHRLVIPRGALSQYTVISAETPVAAAVTVRFSPHGLKFRKPAHLEMDYSSCVQLPLLRPRIVYTDEHLSILEVLRSLGVLEGDHVAANIDHFSRYAVAY